jgi:hypothetical protein
MDQSVAFNLADQAMNNRQMSIAIDETLGQMDNVFRKRSTCVKKQI